jgi:translation initiation factor IF-1
MQAEERATFEAVIEEKLPGGLFRAVLSENAAHAHKQVTVSLGAGTRQTLVRVIPGDRVLIEISPIDPTRGRIKARIR